MTFGGFFRKHDTLRPFSPPICNPFAQKQEKKKVSQKHILLLHFRANTYRKTKTSTEAERERGREREAAFSFTSKPLYTSAVFKPPHSSFPGRSPSALLAHITRPFFLRQFRYSSGSIGPFLHRCESVLPHPPPLESNPSYQLFPIDKVLPNNHKNPFIFQPEIPSKREVDERAKAFARNHPSSSV